MHESAGAEGGFANRAAVEEQAGGVAQIEIHPRRQFHEQVVRVLAIDQWRALRGFAAGEEVGVALGLHRRLEAEHRFELDAAKAGLPLGHQHGHRGGVDLGVAARAAGMGVLGGDCAVEHQHPIARHDVEAGHGAFVCGKPGSAGAR